MQATVDMIKTSTIMKDYTEKKFKTTLEKSDNMNYRIWIARHYYQYLTTIIYEP